MKSDIEIAQAAQMRPITAVADDLGIPDEALAPYGRWKAKVSLPWLQTLADRPQGKLVLVTAVSPTPAGEGKTTTSVGLGDALSAIGEKAMICLREPALGPVFGMKGGAAGGGRSQVVPMEDINLHFTGDFAAIGVAVNLLAAIIDNHLHHGNELGIDVRRISWRRVLDMNDRSLRDVVTGLGGPTNGQPEQTGFDIVVASEVMAIFCLATSLADLKERLGRIVVAHNLAGEPVLARDLGVHGAMTAVLRDALSPNLVQTIEHTPAFIHGGPFANIAHGCNSVIATSAALRLADYVVTEAGFGADLGAEKFIDIVGRSSDLRPSAVVLVATVRSAKYQGGVAAADLAVPDVDAVTRGVVNLERHLSTIQTVYGLPCVVGINHRADDTDDELAVLVAAAERAGATAVVARHFAEGGAGALDLAREVVRLCAEPTEGPTLVYPDDLPLWEKLRAVATRVHGAADISAPDSVLRKLRRWEEQGHGHLPVCVAKTPYSFTTDPSRRGAPSGHTLDVRDVRLSAGAGFVVMICGAVMTMPGLPKSPSALRIDVDDDGRITGLF